MSFCLSHFAGHISLVPFVFFQSIHYFFGRVCGCVGGLGGVEKLAIKLSLAQLSWAGAWNELGNDKRWCWYQIILTNISIFILKTDAHVFCSYARARARIDLKFFGHEEIWFELKFQIWERSEQRLWRNWLPKLVNFHKKHRKYRASAKGALAKGTISSTGTNSSYQVFYGTNSLYLHF